MRGLQRPTAGLAARVGAQLVIQRRDPNLDGVDHRERDRDLLASRRRQRELLNPRAVLAGEQASTLGQPVVIQHGLHPLLALTALVDEGVAQPDPGAEIQQLVRRDPALRQPAGHQQLPQMPRVSAVVLRALLVAAQRARLRRLREMHPRADPAQLLGHEPPAGRRLQRHLEL
jgi:hypothetical protein